MNKLIFKGLANHELVALSINVKDLAWKCFPIFCGILWLHLLIHELFSRENAQQTFLQKKEKNSDNLFCKEMFS